MDDGLAAARGCFWGLIFSVPLWAVIVRLAWLVLR